MDSKYKKIDKYVSGKTTPEETIDTSFLPPGLVQGSKKSKDDKKES